MTLLSYTRLLWRFKWVLFAAPVLTAALVYFALRGQPDEYESHSVIYTGLVSGFNLESGSEARLDYHVVNSGFDNLITTIQSRETLVDVTSDLLTRVACGSASYPMMINDDAFPGLVESLEGLGATCEARSAAIAGQIAAGEGPLYELLFKSSTALSMKSIAGRLNVRRINSSDLLEVKFTAEDPNFAHDFVTVLNDAFIGRFQGIKRKEVGSVVAFFERETAKAQERLQLAVTRMRDFGTANRVINYYEQTKAIAGQKELIDQQIQQEKMRLEAAESAVRDLEERIGATEEIRRRGRELMALRQEYAETTASAVLEGQLTASSSPAGVVQDPLPGLTQQIEQSVAGLYDARYSKEGLVKTELVERWMEEMIVVAQSRASLEVLNDRRAEYIKFYDEFAPMGSTLQTLEREVDVAENEYLELLHSLNQARMRQQNIELSSSMDVLDTPSFPHEPLGGKLKLLMIAAFMVTFLLGVGVITAMELLDESLRSPAEAKKRTGMDVLGAIPDLSVLPPDQPHHPDVQRAVDVLSARLKTILASNSDRDTHLVCLASCAEGDGKRTVSDLLAQSLRSSGRHVIQVGPGRSRLESNGLPESSTFEVNAGYAAMNHVSDLLNLPLDQKVVILMELAPLSDNEIPVGLLESADLTLWVARADSIWTELEQSTLRFARELGGIDPVLCLNAVRWDRLESSVGERRHSRSGIRRSVKRLLQRNFSPSFS